MNRTRILALAAAGLLPLAAQTPLFNDGTAFGGSRIFAEGLSPLGNPARFDQSPSGWYLSAVDGDQRAQDNKSILAATLATDAGAVDAALARLKDAPWALRTRAYGLTGVKDGSNFGISREEFHSSWATTDLADLGDPALNTSYLDGRRTVVDRIHFGGGALASGTAAGFNLRLERWSTGTVRANLFQAPGAWGTDQPRYVYSADDYVMDYATTTARTLTASLDMGFTTQLAEGLRIGAMVDQLNHKRLWDIDLKPQFRAGLQLDLGANARLSVESDVNAVARMPFPVKQQVSAASLRYQVSPSVIFLVGGERRKLGDITTTRAGATLQVRTSALALSFGFQAGQDRPLKGLSLMVN